MSNHEDPAGQSAQLRPSTPETAASDAASADASASSSLSSPPPQTPRPGKPEPIVFRGRSGDYFKLWAVNLFLSVITLGIYSAWAKVRRMRYLYDHTTLSGVSFEYHGNPVAILKGRIIAVVLFVLYKMAVIASPLLALVALVAVGLVAPWLIWRSLQFKLHNSSYSGVRFGLRGSLGGAYTSFLLWPLAALFSFGMLTPLAHQRIKRFQHNASRFGATHFSFHAPVGGFYRTYLVGIGIWLAGMLAIVIGFGGLGFVLASHDQVTDGHGATASIFLMMLSVFTWSALAWPLFTTLLQNLIWNHTRLGEHHFICDMRWGRMMFIMVTNAIGIVLSMGLYTPMAQLRVLRYRLQCMSIVTAGTLYDFVSANEPAGSATGEGMSDLLDFDLSL